MCVRVLFLFILINDIANASVQTLEIPHSGWLSGLLYATFVSYKRNFSLVTSRNTFGPYFWTVGYHFCRSLLEVTSGGYFCASHLYFTFRCHFWISLLDVTFESHFWHTDLWLSQGASWSAYNFTPFH